MGIDSVLGNPSLLILIVLAIVSGTFFIQHLLTIILRWPRLVAKSFSRERNKIISITKQFQDFAFCSDFGSTG